MSDLAMYRQLPRGFVIASSKYSRLTNGVWPVKNGPSERNQSLTDFLAMLISSGGCMKAVGQSAFVRAQPLIAVRNVRESSRWYRHLLGFDSLPEHPHREVSDRMQCRGELILQLHAWDKDAHPNLVNADAAPPGHGVLLWFEVGDLDEVVERARASRAQVILEPHINPNPKHREIWLRDPDGYVVVIASPDGEVSS
jgi:catechol 2,3-dioxygenase-like lactoylglutathione lyase family enzyme